MKPNGPENAGCNEQRDIGDDVVGFGAQLFAGNEQAGKINGGNKQHNTEQNVFKVVVIHQACGEYDGQNHQCTDETCQHKCFFVGFKRIHGCGGWQVFAAARVLCQTECHADGCCAEAPVETDLVLQVTGQQRAEECADIDGEIKQRKAGIAQMLGVIMLVQRADHCAGRGFHAAAAQGY